MRKRPKDFNAEQYNPSNQQALRLMHKKSYFLVVLSLVAVLGVFYSQQQPQKLGKAGEEELSHNK